MLSGYNVQQAMQREYQSDLWIQQNVPGGLNGRQIDNYLGGNTNPTAGQIYGRQPFSHGYGTGYGYHYGRWEIRITI